jgi:TetR/AcrR family transcriptional repressor of nem operon
MVKVTREQVAANREALVEAAGRLFRERGIDSVGVAELCGAAGLTHGALYSQFGSKEALAAEAFRQGQSASRQRTIAALGQTPDLVSIIDLYVSPRHRDNPSDCCPMLASASEAARQGELFRSTYAESFRDLSRLLRTAESDEVLEADLSIVIAASMIGVVAVARAVKSVDPALSNRLMETSRAAFMQIAAASEEPTISKRGASTRRARKLPSNSG